LLTSGEDATGWTRFIRFSLILRSFVTTRLQGVKMRKKYAVGQQPKDSAEAPGTDKVSASAKLTAKARDAASRRFPSKTIVRTGSKP
jgi:hypothetical protein